MCQSVNSFSALKTQHTASAVVGGILEGKGDVVDARGVAWIDQARIKLIVVKVGGNHLPLGIIHGYNDSIRIGALITNVKVVLGILAKNIRKLNFGFGTTLTVNFKGFQKGKSVLQFGNARIGQLLRIALAMSGLSFNHQGYSDNSNEFKYASHTNL